MQHPVPIGAVGLGGDGSVQVAVVSQNVVSQFLRYVEIVAVQLVEQFGISLVRQLVLARRRDGPDNKILIRQYQPVCLQVGEEPAVKVEGLVETIHVQLFDGGSQRPVYQRFE